MRADERIHGLDAVRAFALLIGIAMHVVGPWLENLPDAIFREEPSATAAAIWFFPHIFRMPVFFLVAGYFGRLLAERYPTRQFVKDRAKRIALPLVIGFFAITALMGLAFALGCLASGMSFAEATALLQAQSEQIASAGDARGGLDRVGLGHLWFLYYLLLFYGIALVSRAAARAVDRDGKVLSGIDRMLGFLMRTGFAVAVFALPIAAWYVFMWPEWPHWQGLPAPQSLIPSIPAVLGYGVSFAVGWLLHRQSHLLLQLRDRWVAYSLGALVFAVACYLIVGPTPQWSPHLYGWKLDVYAATYLLATWCASFALIGAALRFLSDGSPVRRYVADSSYWMYLMHPVPILFFMLLLRPLDWHWSVKFSITLTASVLLLLLTYYAFVRSTFIGATLNGRRRPRGVEREPGTSKPVRQSSRSFQEPAVSPPVSGGTGVGTAALDRAGFKPPTQSANPRALPPADVDIEGADVVDAPVGPSGSPRGGADVPKVPS